MLYLQNFIMLQTMTSRYIDTQLSLCVYVHLWVCECKELWKPQKAGWKSCVWSLRWVNKAEIEREGTWRFSGGDIHTQTSEKGVSLKKACPLSSLWIIKVQWVSTRKQVRWERWSMKEHSRRETSLNTPSEQKQWEDSPVVEYRHTFAHTIIHNTIQTCTCALAHKTSCDLIGSHLSDNFGFLFVF